MSNSEIILKYGCNPHQKPARIYSKTENLPITVLNGKPGYINFMDAFNSWQLVKELKETLKLPAAASFKHVSPAGAAVGLPMSEELKKACFVDDLELSPLAAAYARARGADRLCSYGDFVAVSDVVDVPTAKILSREVSDGIIAPGYESAALEILKSKRKGTYNVIQIDKDYEPSDIENKEVFGISFEQKRNNVSIDASLLNNIITKNKELSEAAKRDLIISMITLKYTQSNSVCFVYDGQVIGCGAGQQSRIHCVRLAASKAKLWYLRQHPEILELPFRDNISRPERDNAIDQFLREDISEAEKRQLQNAFKSIPAAFTEDKIKGFLKTMQGASLGSDAFFPFRDNIDCAQQYGVKYIAEPGGSLRDADVIEACDEYGMVMCFTGLRLFHH